TSPRSPQPSRPLPTPSSWSIKPAGTCPRASSCRPISPSFCCRRSAQSSTRSRTSGSSCATTGSPTASSNPTTISSTIVVRHGTSSSISLGASCPSDCANGPTGSDQWDLVEHHGRGDERVPGDAQRVGAGKERASNEQDHHPAEGGAEGGEDTRGREPGRMRADHQRQPQE